MEGGPRAPVRSLTRHVATPRRLITLGLVSATVVGCFFPGSRRALRTLTAPLEIAVLVGAGLAVRRALRMNRADVAEAWDAAMVATLGDHAVARFVAAEVSAIHYAFSWRRSRPSPSGTRFTLEATRAPAITWGLVLVTMIEGAVAHIALGEAHRIAAWAMTALGVYAAIWLVGQDRAIAARAIVVEGEALTLRVGLRLTARIPWSVISRAGYLRTRARRGRHDLDAARPSDPNLRITLRRPVLVSGAFGMQRRVKRIDLCVDDPDALRGAIRRHVAPSVGAVSGSSRSRRAAA